MYTNNPKVDKLILNYGGLPRGFQGHRYPQPSHYRAMYKAGYYSKYKSPRLPYKYRPFRYGFARTAANKVIPAAQFASAVNTQFQNRHFRQKYFIADKHMLVNYRSRMPRARKARPFTTHGVRMPKKVSTNQQHKWKRRQKRKAAAKRQGKTNTALATQIKDIRKEIGADRSVHTYRLANSTIVNSTKGAANHHVLTINRLTDYETMIANLRYYDPATPGTLVTASGATGTFHRDIRFDDIYSKIECRNNYQVPCKLKVYVATVKKNASSTSDPVTLMNSAATDQVINGGITDTSPLIFFSDFEMVKDLWSFDCLVDKELEPGQSCTAVHNTGPVDYDPARSDTETDAYQHVLKSFVWCIRIEGVLGHSGSEYGLLAAAVDVQWFVKATIKYDAGINLNDIYVTDSRDTFTTTGLVSLKPVADNIAYSAT